MKKIIKKKAGAKKKAAKKAAPKKAKTVKKKSSKPKELGFVTHYYGGIKVAIIKVKQAFSVGDEARFSGATTAFSQTLDSIQYDHKAIQKTSKGKEVGIKVKKRVRQGDAIFLIEE